MMNVRDTNIGKIVRVLRENRGITRLSLAEAVGISESYLKKIETGVRQPGVHLYQKMLEELEAVLVIVHDFTTFINNSLTVELAVLRHS